MHKLKKTTWIALLLLSLLLLSGCGFQPRQASDVPPQLHTLTLQSSKPYGNLTTQVKAMLRSLDITLVKRHEQSPYTLHIISITFSQSNPPITTTSLATTETYSLTVNIKLTSRSGKMIIPEKMISASRSISQNASQVYTPGAATLAKQELQRDVISKLYYLLTSNNTRKALNKRSSSRWIASPLRGSQ